MSRIENAGRSPEDEFIAQYNSTREIPLNSFEETRMRSLLIKYKSIVGVPVRMCNRPTQQELSFRKKYNFPTNATNDQKVQHITTIVADHLSIRKEHLFKKSRDKLFVYGRRICMHFIYVTTTLSLKAIGELFNRDHTTVMHSNRQYFDILQTDEKYLQDYELFKSYLLDGKRRLFPVRTEQGEKSKAM